MPARENGDPPVHASRLHADIQRWFIRWGIPIRGLIHRRPQSNLVNIFDPLPNNSSPHAYTRVRLLNFRFALSLLRSAILSPRKFRLYGRPLVPSDYSLNNYRIAPIGDHRGKETKKCCSDGSDWWDTRRISVQRETGSIIRNYWTLIGSRKETMGG